MSQAKTALDLDLLIGINGGGMRIEPGIDAIKLLPLDSILAESGAPFCDIYSGNLALPYVQTIFPRITAKFYQ